MKELDRSEKFYTEIMGMEKIRRTGHMVFLRAAGKDNFVLTYSEKPIDPNPIGKHGIHSAFEMSADEYDRAKAFLASKGISIFKEEDRRSGTFQGRSAYFHDPDHNVIEIMDSRPRTCGRKRSEAVVAVAASGCVKRTRAPIRA